MLFYPKYYLHITGPGTTCGWVILRNSYPGNAQSIVGDWNASKVGARARRERVNCQICCVANLDETSIGLSYRTSSQYNLYWTTELKILTEVVVIDVPGICSLYVSILNKCQWQPRYEWEVLLVVTHQTRVVVAWISRLDSNLSTSSWCVAGNVALKEGDNSQASSEKTDGVDKGHDEEYK
mgnify:CR=1 FL=1